METADKFLDDRPGRGLDPRKYCRRCWEMNTWQFSLQVRPDNTRLCLICGSVYDSKGKYIGHIKSWDEPNILIPRPREEKEVEE